MRCAGSTWRSGAWADAGWRKPGTSGIGRYQRRMTAWPWPRPSPWYRATIIPDTACGERATAPRSCPATRPPPGESRSHSLQMPTTAIFCILVWRATLGEGNFSLWSSSWKAGASSWEPITVKPSIYLLMLLSLFLSLPTYYWVLYDFTPRAKMSTSKPALQYSIPSSIPFCRLTENEPLSTPHTHTHLPSLFLYLSLSLTLSISLSLKHTQTC